MGVKDLVSPTSKKSSVDPEITQSNKSGLPSLKQSPKTSATSITATSPDLTSAPQHGNSCNRCYKLKKKCTRTFPKCFNCNKAGETCEYVERSNKRRKKISVSENEKIIGNINQSTFTIENIVPSSQNYSQVFQLSNSSRYKSDIVESSAAKSSPRKEKSKAKEKEKPKEKKEDKSRGTTTLEDVSRDETRVQTDEKIILPPINTPHRHVSISSLLSSDSIASKPIPTTIVIPVKSVKHEECFRITNKLLQVSWNSKTDNNILDEEYITMQPMSNDLLLKFANLFFANFELVFPFLDNKSQVLKTLNSTDFEKESIITFDIYLIICIGCIIYDDNNSSAESNQFNKLFNEKYVESIIDVLTFKDLANVRLLILLKLFAQLTFNFKLSWEVSGVINRMILRFNLHEKSYVDTVAKERIFWTVYNIDKASSLILNKPSQLPDQFISHSLPLSSWKVDGAEEELLELKTAFIELANLQNQLNILKLSLAITKDIKYYEAYKVTYKTELESWYIKTTKLLNFHKQNELISWVNINYNYLLIEFEYLNDPLHNEAVIPSIILQFLSNSYNLLTSNNYSITNINWLLQNLSMLNKSLLYLHNNCFNMKTKVINLNNLNNFKNLLQLLINIFIVLQKKSLLANKYWISSIISLLSDLNLKLMELNMINDGNNSKNSDDLINNIYGVRDEFDSIMMQNEIKYYN